MNKRRALFVSITLLITHYGNAQTRLFQIDELFFKNLTQRHNPAFILWINSAPAPVCELFPTTNPDAIDWLALGEQYGALLTTDEHVVSRAIDLGLVVYHFDRHKTEGYIIILNTHDRQGMIEWITTS